MAAADRKAVFFDRDGVLNDLVYYPSSGEWESPRCRDDFRLRPGVGKVMKALSEAGWLLFLVSNQPSHAKGKATLEALKDVHAALEEALSAEGVHLQEAYYCFHHPDAILPEWRGPCACRKPSPHFLLEASRIHGVDLSSSWMIGDQDMDLLFGKRAGCGTILVPNPDSASKRGKVAPDHICDDLAQVLPILC